MKRVFCILAFVLASLLCFCSCGTEKLNEEPTEYDKLALTAVNETPEEIFEKVFSEEEIRSLDTEGTKRVELLKSRKTLNEIRERILEKDEKIFETVSISLGVKDDVICIIYHLQTDCRLISVLVK